LGGNGNAQQEANEPRFGVIMNPYNLPQGVVRQLFVTEPFYNTIAIVNLTVVGTTEAAKIARVGMPCCSC
jgi:hypothetical protein